jgi:hypothetical protein
MRPVLILVLLAVACTESNQTPAEAAGCADVVAVEIAEQADANYRFDVTVASADTGWDKYADAWEIRDEGGAVLATRVLAHPHVDEQPFTRSLSNVEIPASVEEVHVAARDSVEGFCGRTVTVSLP